MAASTAKVPVRARTFSLADLRSEVSRPLHLRRTAAGSQRIPQKWLGSGVIVKTSSLRRTRYRHRPAGRSVALHGGPIQRLACTGVDEDFHRGRSAVATITTATRPSSPIPIWVRSPIITMRAGSATGAIGGADPHRRSRPGPADDGSVIEGSTPPETSVRR